jgi:hypothetical protein
MCRLRCCCCCIFRRPHPPHPRTWTLPTPGARLFILLVIRHTDAALLTRPASHHARNPLRRPPSPSSSFLLVTHQRRLRLRRELHKLVATGAKITAPCKAHKWPIFTTRPIEGGIEIFAAPTGRQQGGAAGDNTHTHTHTHTHVHTTRTSAAKQGCWLCVGMAASDREG